MRRGVMAVASVGVLLISATAAGAADGIELDGGQGSRETAMQEVRIRDVNGDRIGTVLFRQTQEWVRVRANLRSLPAGFHGFHVHQTGICDPNADGGPFFSAGGHYTDGDSSHGDHAGDMPSLLVKDDERARLAFRTDRFTLEELRAGDGAAAMVHADRDNFANIPDRYTSEGKPGPDEMTLATGDAGARVACGVID